MAASGCAAGSSLLLFPEHQAQSTQPLVNKKLAQEGRQIAVNHLQYFHAHHTTHTLTLLLARPHQLAAPSKAAP